jgi:pimeloyl-ACP methyl ester carboxylesterase
MLSLFNYKNTTISYLKQGKGKTIVLLHGFGEDSNIFNKQVEFLKKFCCVILPDLPGSGESPLNVELTTIEDFAAAILALLQHESIETCTMLGHSMGGYITLAFAELYPEKLNAFGLLHSTAFADSTAKKESRKQGIELIKTYGAYAFLKTTTPNLFGKNFKEAFPHAIASLIEDGKQFTVEALQQYYTAMMNRKDKTHVLQSNSLPVLFVLGTEDVAAPINDVLKQTHLPLCSYISVLQNVGHMGMWEATEKMNKALQDFIENVF